MTSFIGKKNFQIKVPTKYKLKDFNLKFKLGNSLQGKLFDTVSYNLVNKYKKYIDVVNKNDIWNDYKGYSNLFEIISYNNYSKNVKPITLYEPISRAYFKFWEILQDFKLLDNTKKKYIFAALAEGPGGFVECFVNKRKKDFQGKYDQIFCITLKPVRHEIPGWSKTIKVLKRYKNIYIDYGKDNTGDLYNIENIIHFKKKIQEKVDLVSADGGFDYSINFDRQEELSYRLIFSEIVTAFTILKKGGNFVLKIFDIFTELTLKMMYLLASFYEKITFTKPNTSRPANSERYVICENFQGMSEELLFKLHKIIETWELSENKYIIDVFDFKVPHFFINSIKIYNSTIAKKQIENIIKTSSYIIQKPNKNKKLKIMVEQAVYSLLWCKKYHQNINFKSGFLKLLKNYHI